MTRSVEEQMADIERRMKQLRARKQRIVARENAKARKRRTHLIIRLGGILSNNASSMWHARRAARPKTPACYREAGSAGPRRGRWRSNPSCCAGRLRG